MNNIPTWAQITLTGLGTFAAGISVLWFLARRALLADDEESGRKPRRPRRSILRRLEARLMRLLLRPPQWHQIQPYVLGVGSVAAGGFAIWALVNWLATAPTPPVPSSVGVGPTLPFESLAEQLSRSIATMSTAIGICAFIAVGALAMMGETGRVFKLGIAVVVGATLMRCSPMMFTELAGSDAPASQPFASSESRQVERAPAPEEPSPEPEAIEESSPATSSETVETPKPTDYPAAQVAASEARAVSGAAEQLGDGQSQSSSTAISHDSARARDDHFGIGDALMMYGAYRLLTHDSNSRAPAVIHTHTHTPAPARSLSTSVAPTPSAARVQPAPSQHVSTPSPPPTYKPSTGRVSAIRTAPVRSTPVFRSSGRRSR